MTGLDKLTGRILSEAEEFARGLLESAQAEIAEIDKAKESKIGYIKNEYTARAEKEEKAILERADAAAGSLSRDIVLAAKTALLDNVFEQAKHRLLRLAESGSDEYVNILAALLRKTAAAAAASEQAASEYDEDDAPPAQSGYEALFGSRDLAGGSSSVANKAVLLAASELAKAGKTITVSGTPADIEGGFILRVGNIEYNCSLSALITGCRAALESEIYRMLFEQTEHEKEV